jgi:hypothetical protein
MALALEGIIAMRRYKLQVSSRSRNFEKFNGPC